MHISCMIKYQGANVAISDIHSKLMHEFRIQTKKLYNPTSIIEAKIEIFRGGFKLFVWTENLKKGLGFFSQKPL